MLDHVLAGQAEGDESIMAELRELLWTVAVGPDAYSDTASSGYQAAVLEQYKIYVEMADRISERRALTNTFFLTLNTAIMTVVALFWKERPAAPKLALVFPLLAILAQCFAWFYLCHSYGQLNAAKYRVIGGLEERLPASPYWRAEWTLLAEGKDFRRYWPLSHIERWIPLLFGSSYIFAFIAVLVR